MNNLIAKLAEGCKRLQTSVAAALGLLFAARIFSVLLNVTQNTGELLRPDLSYPDFALPSSGLLLILVFILYFSSVRKFSEEFQFSSAIYYPLTYTFLSLCNVQAGGRMFLYRIINDQATFQDFLAVFTMDLLFQPPYLLWALGWYALIFFFIWRSKKSRIIDVFCILPFALMPFNVSNFQLAFFITLAALILFNLKISRPARPDLLLHFWCGSFLLSLVFLSLHSFIYRATLISAVILLPISWLSGAFFLYRVDQQPLPNELKTRHSWFVMLFFGIIFSQSINLIPIGPGLFDFWFLLASFNFAFLSVIPLLVIYVLSILIGFLKRNFELPAFWAMTFFVASFFVIDGFVMLKSGQKLDYHAINWVLGLNSFNSIFTTAIALLNWQNLTGLALLPLLGWVLVKFRHNYQNGEWLKDLRIPWQSLFVTTTISFISLRLLAAPLHVLSDPVRNLIATVPIFQDIFDSRPRWPELRQKLAQNGFDIEKATEELRQAQANRETASNANLILIVLESTGSKYMSLFGAKDLTMPALEKVKDRIEIFPFYFSTFPESANADFSIMTSLMPSNFHILRSKPRFYGNTLIELLKATGYECSLFFSLLLGDTGLNSFYLPRGADHVYDAATMPGITSEDGWIWGLKEHVVVNRIENFLQQRGPDQHPFFILYRTIFPHAPFDQIDDNPVKAFPEDDLMSGKAVGRFKNSLVYVDRQISRILDMLEKQGLASNTYVMVTSDHATMLGENGQYGHGWNLNPELTNVPLFIIHPRADGFKINTNPGSHIDILPTALNLIGAKASRPIFVQGHDLRLDGVRNHSTFISSFDGQALIEGSRYYWYLKNENEVRAFNFSLQGQKAIFTPIKNQTEEALREKVEIMKSMVSLQRHLLMNYEQYFESFKSAGNNL